MTDFDKTMAILSGQSVENFLDRQLTERDKTQIRNAIELLFSGLSLRNWLDGGVLRDAWESALDTLRDMIFEIPHNNAATTFMRAATFEHRAKWRSQIVASRNANDAIKCPPEQYEQWQSNAEIKIKEGAEILRRKVLDFESGTPRTTSVQHQAYNMGHTHTTNERKQEYVRERVK